MNTLAHYYRLIRNIMFGNDDLQGLGNKKKITTALFIISFIAIVISLIKVTQTVFSSPLNEYREMANVAAILNIRSGALFDMSHFAGSIYLYGLLQPWLLSFLPDSWDPIFLNRVASYSFMVIAFILFIIIQKRLFLLLNIPAAGKTLLATGLIYLNCLLSIAPSNMGPPNFLGMALTNAILLLSLYSFRGKTLLLAVLVAASFLTKQYFLFSLVYGALAFIFLENKHKWLKLSFFMVASVALVSLCFLLDETRYAILHHFVAQQPFRKTLPLFWIKLSQFVILLIPLFWIFYKQAIIDSTKPEQEKTAKPSPYFLFIISAFILAFLAIVKVGGHGGAIGLMYYVHILLTPACLCGSILLAKNQKNGLFTIAIALLALVAIQTTADINRTKKKHHWDNIAMIQKEMQEHGRQYVLGCPMTSFLEISLFRQASDPGQLEYYHTLNTSPGSFRELLGGVNAQNEQFQKQLIEDLNRKKYKVIYTDAISLLETQEIFNKELMKNYIRTGSYVISSKLAGKEVTRWVPRSM